MRMSRIWIFVVGSNIKHSMGSDMRKKHWHLIFLLSMQSLIECLHLIYFLKQTKDACLYKSPNSKALDSSWFQCLDYLF